MRIGFRPALACSALLLFSAAHQAMATAVTYSTYANWVANVTGATELNFSAVGQSGTYSNSTGKTLTPTSGPALPFVFTGPLTASGYYLVGGDYTTSNIVSLFGPKNGAGNISVALPSSGENALLVGLGNTGATSNYTLSFSDGSTYSVPVATNALTFFGISISHDVSWLTISGSNQPIVDDFWFANSKLTQDPSGQATPVTGTVECSTMALMGTGLLILVAGRRKLFPNAHLA